MAATPSPRRSPIRRAASAVSSPLAEIGGRRRQRSSPPRGPGCRPARSLRSCRARPSRRWSRPAPCTRVSPSRSSPCPSSPSRTSSTASARRRRQGAAPQIVVLLDQVTRPAQCRRGAALGRRLRRPRPGPARARRAAESPARSPRRPRARVEHVPIVRVVNLARAIDRLKGAGFWCVGLDEAAEQTLAALKLDGRIALVLGGEGDGMRRLTRERCDLVARLPTPAPSPRSTSRTPRRSRSTS